MNANIDLERLRHVRNFNKDTEGQDANGKKWKSFKSGIDGLSGLLVQSGLVHALLGTLAGKSESAKAMKNAADALKSWLVSDKSPVQGIAKSVCNQNPNPSIEDFIFSLMSLNSTGGAMAIQAEAMRYLAQAKLLATAFESNS